MKRNRALALAGLLVLAAAGGIYHQSPRLAAALLTQRAAAAGFELTAFEMERPGLEAARVSRLVVRRADGLRLSLRELRLDYRPAELLQGRLSAVTVAAGELLLPEKGAEGGGLPLPPRDLFAALPFTEAKVQRFSLVRPGGAPARLTLGGRVEQAAEGVRATFSAVTDGLDALEFSLSSHGDRLELALRGELGEGSAVVRYGPPGAVVEAALEADLIKLRRLLGASPLDQLQLQGGRLAARGRLTVADGSDGPRLAEVALLPGSQLALEQLRVGAAELPRLGLELLEPLTLSPAAGAGEAAGWGLAGPTRIGLAALRFEASGLWQAEQGELQLTRLLPGGAGLQLEGGLRLEGVRGRLGEAESGPARLEAALALEGETLRLRPVVELPGGMGRVTGELTHDLEDARGEGELTLEPVDLAAHPLHTLAQPWSAPFDLTGGRLAGSVRLRWRKRLTADWSLAPEGLELRFGESRASGLAGALRGRYDSQRGLLSAAGELNAKRLESGLRFEDLAVRLEARPGSGPWPLLQIAAARARLLGGELSAEGVVIDPALPANPFTLTLREVDLALLLALEQQQGVEGSGTLDGELPLSVGREGVRVSGGRVAAREPGGVIRYLPTEAAKAAAAENPALDFAMRALADYQYQALEAGVEYSPEGSLTLALAVKGRNPAVSPEPIDLNVNLTENVPALLRSLRIGNEVGGAVDRRVQQRLRDAP